MTPLKKATIILIHGAFHGPECFRPLTPYLLSAGYPCIDDLALPGTGNNSTSSLQQDADAIRDAVLDVLEGDEEKGREGNNCVLVMHSYGAVPAAQGLGGLDRESRGEGKTAILKMVYLTCNIPKLGESHWEQFQAYLEEKGGATDPVVENKDGVLTFTGGPDAFYSGLDEETKSQLYKALKTQSAASLTTPLTRTAYKHIPAWYLVTTKDAIMPPDFQRSIISTAGASIEHVGEIETGHSSFLARPDAVADFILRAVRSIKSNVDI